LEISDNLKQRILEPIYIETNQQQESNFQNNQNSNQISNQPSNFISTMQDMVNIFQNPLILNYMNTKSTK